MTMSDGRWHITAAYGRCIEGMQRTQADIDARLLWLSSTAKTQADIDDDFDLHLLLIDRKNWSLLMAETPKFLDWVSHD